MLLRTDTGYVAGTYDALGIVKDISTGRFHAFVWEEKPFPGGQQPDTAIRLKSKMHHTVGADTFEGALGHVADLRKKIEVSDDNVWTKAEQVIERDFQTDGYADVLVLPNWKKAV